MGRWFWLISAPAAWVAGFSVCRLAVSMGAPRLGAFGLGLLTCLAVALFVQHLINHLVASRGRA